jgi:3-oxoacyl-[acyl-carrier protein] reductase
VPPRQVLITGSSRGLGAALAEHYLESGDRVIGCSRSASPLTHERYLHCAIDVTDSAAVDGLFRDLKRQFKTLDVLINNAGIKLEHHPSPPSTASIADVSAGMTSS